jgi:amidase
LPDPGTTFLAATAQKLGSLRIAFSTTIPPIGEADSASGQAVQKTVQLLEEMGHTVEPGCPDFTDLIKPFAKVWQAGVAATGIPGDYMEPMNRWMLEQSGSAGEYLQAVAQMQIMARRIVAFFDNYDVLVVPIYMHQPIRVGEWAHLNPEERLQKIIQWIAPCPPFNATGQPAISLPTGFDANGLPIGVQLVGRPADETTLIALAAQLEAAKLWSASRPDFAAQ